MPLGEYTNLSVKRGEMEELQKLYEKSKIENSFTVWVVNNVKAHAILSEILMKKYLHLEFVPTKHHLVIIRDKKQDDLYEIIFKNGLPYCKKDSSSSCDHSQFAIISENLFNQKMEK